MTKSGVKKIEEGMDVFVLMYLLLKLEPVNIFMLREIKQKILPTVNMGIQVKGKQTY